MSISWLEVIVFFLKCPQKKRCTAAWWLVPKEHWLLGACVPTPTEEWRTSWKIRRTSRFPFFWASKKDFTTQVPPVSILPHFFAYLSSAEDWPFISLSLTLLGLGPSPVSPEVTQMFSQSKCKAIFTIVFGNLWAHIAGCLSKFQVPRVHVSCCPQFEAWLFWVLPFTGRLVPPCFFCGATHPCFCRPVLHTVCFSTLF